MTELLSSSTAESAVTQPITSSPPSSSSSSSMPAAHPAHKQTMDTSAVIIDADDVNLISDDLLNGHGEEDDFERILIPDTTNDSTSHGSSCAASRFTKSDKDAMIHMIYDDIGVRKRSISDADEEDEDRVMFLSGDGSDGHKSDSITSKFNVKKAIADMSDQSKGKTNRKKKTTSSKKRSKDQMKQYLINDDDENDPENNDEEDDDLHLSSPTLCPSEESSFTIFVQVFIPFLVAGFGTVAAGLVLDYVQHWEVFRNVSEVFILVPALLGLKGNLEMTLASRLSTAANMGLLSSPKDQWNISVGNIALIQAQAAVVALLAALFAILMDWLPEGEFNMDHAVLLVASSLLTASIASFLLAILMIVVVILSHKFNINPDNVATPIAASLGDLTTLTLLANISNILYFTIDKGIWLSIVLIIVLICLIPVWILISHQNRSTRDVLYYGWTPVISAMAISSAGGMILDFAVSRFTGIAVFQPVINGVGGNLVAVQSSRISTYLHQRSVPGILPRENEDGMLCASPLTTFCGPHVHAKTARVLLFIAIPGHLIFTSAIALVQAGHTRITISFLMVYLTAAMIQILILLFLSRSLIMWMWVKHIDPDNSAIPYLTAIGDLLGTALLAAAFFAHDFHVSVVADGKVS